MTTGTEVMKNFFSALKDFSYEDNFSVKAELDHAIRAVSPVIDWENAVSRFQDAITSGMAVSETGEVDTATTLQNLQQFTGIVLGDNYDLTADTGAISGANAGGSIVKDAQSIVPEDGDLSTAILPDAGSTSQITYTGDDGKSFTFNVKWPDSYEKFYSGTAIDTNTSIVDRLRDTRFIVDLNDFNSDEVFEEGVTYGNMKNSAPIILKALNTYWLKESAKLIYDSYGLDFDGKTIEIQFVAGGDYGDVSGITVARNTDNLPSDDIIIGINLVAYGNIDPTNPNGAALNTTGGINIDIMYLDRVVAHEMVHAAMMASGTLKELRMPAFLGEGIADLVHGDEDYNSRQSGPIRYLATHSDTLVQTLSGTGDNGLAYPAGHMFLRYIANQASDTTIFVGTEENKSQTIDFNGGGAIITNYDESNTINYNANFKTAALPYLRFNDFAIDSGDDKGLLIRDVRGKMMTFTNPVGNIAYATMANSAGELDGRTLGDGNNFEVLFGMNSSNNILRAGNGGSQLWGGYLGNDELYGGAGEDVFIYDINGGNDTIHDAESQDIVLLRNVSLDQVTRAEFTDNGVNLSFSYGGTLNILGQPTNFVLESSGAVYAADYQNKSWSANE